jgi:hypothetical protein
MKNDRDFMDVILLHHTKKRRMAGNLVAYRRSAQEEYWHF